MEKITVNAPVNSRQFILITLITSIWIQIAEFARAIMVAFPRMQMFFGDSWTSLGLGPMKPMNMMIWIMWDFLMAFVLGYIVWMTIRAIGNTVSSILISGTVAALATIGVFWIATANTGLGSWGTAGILFLLAWVEMIVGAFIVSKLYERDAFVR